MFLPPFFQHDQNLGRRLGKLMALEHLIGQCGLAPGQGFEVLLPSGIELVESYPNPFQQAVTVRFSISSPDHVKIVVFDNRGREIRSLLDHHILAGYHEIKIDLSDCSPGLYHVRIQTQSGQHVKSVLLTE